MDHAVEGDERGQPAVPRRSSQQQSNESSDDMRPTPRGDSNGTSDLIDEYQSGTHQIAVLNQMPFSSSADTGLPYFTGRNVTRFLEEFELLCDKAYKDYKSRYIFVVQYYDTTYREIIREIPK